MSGGDDRSLSVRVAYGKLVAIADRARQLRQQRDKCTASEVDGVLEAYEAARSLCHDATCEDLAPVYIEDLGRIAEEKHYPPSRLRAILVSVEVECFKGIGALARAIALNSKEEDPRK